MDRHRFFSSLVLFSLLPTAIPSTYFVVRFSAFSAFEAIDDEFCLLGPFFFKYVHESSKQEIIGY